MGQKAAGRVEGKKPRNVGRTNATEGAKVDATNNGIDKASITKGQSRSLPFAQRGIRTASDFAGFMSAMMSDLIEGKIVPQTANATCNAGGKLLKAVEMQIKYGTPRQLSADRKELVLTEK